MICPCGQHDDTTGGSHYVIIHYDKNGRDIVYAVCQHGIVVIDKREENAKV